MVIGPRAEKANMGMGSCMDDRGMQVALAPGRQRLRVPSRTLCLGLALRPTRDLAAEAAAWWSAQHK
eukprot:2763160-Prymnesium_polylepis.2